MSRAAATTCHVGPKDPHRWRLNCPRNRVRYTLVLDSCFVIQEAFAPFFRPDVHFCIARARKGMGKSALLRQFAHQLRTDTRVLVISVTGADLAAQHPVHSLSLYEHMHDWQKRICTVITSELSWRCSLCSVDDVAPPDSAELVDLKQRNLLPALYERLRKTLGPSTTRRTIMRPIHLLALLVFAFSLPSHAVAQSKFFTFEQNTDRPGRDYSNAPSEGASDCSFACQLENRCRAWTYVRPGVQGPSGRCWLKNAVPQALRNTCCTSGVRKGAPVPID
jgi:hypothetical protein